MGAAEKESSSRSVNRLVSLRRLSFACCAKLSGDALEELDHCSPSLNSLSLKGCAGFTSRDLERELPKLKTLGEVDLQWCAAVTEDTVRSVTLLPLLHTLRLSLMTNRGLRQLQALAPSLRCLSFSGQPDLALGRQPPTNDGLCHIMNLHRLEQLTVRISSSFTEHGFARVAQLSSLRALRLDGCTGISVEIISLLAGCTVLRELRLRYSSINDSWLAAVSQFLPRLEALDVSWNAQITTEGLLLLQVMTSLRSLMLCGLEWTATSSGTLQLETVAVVAQAIGAGLIIDVRSWICHCDEECFRDLWLQIAIIGSRLIYVGAEENI